MMLVMNKNIVDVVVCMVVGIRDWQMDRVGVRKIVFKVVGSKNVRIFKMIELERQKKSVKGVEMVIFNVGSYMV